MDKQLKYNFTKHTDKDWLKTIGEELKKEISSFPAFEWEPGCEMPINGQSEKQSESGSVDRGAPGQFPFAAGWKKNENHWEINQRFFWSQPASYIQQALANDVSSVTLYGETQGKDLEHLYKGVLPQFIETHFFDHPDPVTFLPAWMTWLKKNNIPTNEVRCFMGLDPLAYGKGRDISTIHAFVTECRKQLPLSRPLAVNGLYYESEGATLTQRLAFTLAHATEYLNSLVQSGMSVDEASACIAVYLPVSVSFLHEIAALRAFRMLWANVVKAYAPQHNCTHNIYIQAVISDSYWSVYDEYNNLIRATVQSMSAMMGGCDSLCVTPFNAPSNEVNEFSLRLSRNIQHVLKNESYLDKVVDPASGSYYIEGITTKLCSDAWNLFVEIEKQGGFISYIKSGKLRETLDISAGVREELLATGKRPVIGLNKYPNAKEKSVKTGTKRLVENIESHFQLEGGKVK